jgi:hypothetical protein
LLWARYHLSWHAWRIYFLLVSLLNLHFFLLFQL